MRKPALLILFLVQPVFATPLVLQNLDADEYREVVKELSANLTHTSVSGGSSIETPWGFQFGFITGRTNTPHISEYVGESLPERTRKSLPHMNIMGAFKIPLGFTLEFGFVPMVGTEDFKYGTQAGAIKWTPTNIFEGSPVHLAFKAHAQKSHVEFNYELSGTPTQYKYDSLVTGFTGYLSYDIIPSIELFTGAGVVKGTGNLAIDGSNTVFSDPEYQAAQKAKVSVASPIYLFGVDFKMGILHFGLEYSKQFGADTYNGKVSFVP